MSTRYLHRTMALLVAVPLLALAACGTPRTVDPNEPPTTLTVQAKNLDAGPLAEAIHILAPGEGLPCCRLDPGGPRSVTISAQTLALFQFLAVRSGTEQDRVTCQWKGRAQSNCGVERIELELSRLGLAASPLEGAVERS